MSTLTTTITAPTNLTVLSVAEAREVFNRAHARMNETNGRYTKWHATAAELKEAFERRDEAYRMLHAAIIADVEARRKLREITPEMF